MTNLNEFQPFEENLDYNYVQETLAGGTMPSAVACISDRESRMLYAVTNQYGRVNGLPVFDLASLREGEAIEDFIRFRFGAKLKFKEGIDVVKPLPYESNISAEHDIGNNNYPHINERIYHPVVGTASQYPRRSSPLRLVSATEIIECTIDTSGNDIFLQLMDVYREVIDLHSQSSL